ncbi:MAG: tetratricopeptide repeat protein [Armatimonadetes bacterium]|nr:tetratricopeptide repeat protein [Armatimonadota bacterium]
MSNYARLSIITTIALVSLSCQVFAQTDPAVLFGAKPKPQAQADPRAQAQAHFKNAIKYQQAGKLQKAIAEYRAVIKIAPMVPAPYMNIGMIYMQMNQPKNAEAAFKRVLAIDPKNEMATAQLAQVLMFENKNAEALRFARKLMGMKPKEPQYKLLFGTVNMKMKRFDAAEDAFKSVLHINPGDEGALMNLCGCYGAQKKYGDVLAICEKLLKAHPDNLRARMMAAMAAEQIGDRTGAIQHYEALAKVRQAAPQALMNIARLYRIMNKPDKSAEAMKRILKIDKNNFDANFNLGAYEYGKKNIKAAETYWLAARRAQPKNPVVNVNLAMVQARQGKINEASASAQAALKADPKNRMALEVYCFVLENGRKMDEAVRVYRRWQKYYPTDPIPNRKIAGIYMFQNKKDKAYPEFDLALKKAPKDLDTINTYAMALKMDEKYDKAYALYEKALKVKPGVAQTMFDAAFCLEKQKKPDEAIALLKKAVANDAKNVMYRGKLAELIEQKQDYPAVLEQYNEMAKNDDVGTKSFALFKIGSIQEKQNKPDDAIASYKKSLEARPSAPNSLEALAKLYEAQKKTEEFLPYLKTLVEPGKDESPYGFFFDKYKAAGKTDEAIKSLEEISGKNPDNVAIRYVLATAYKGANQQDKAIEQYNAIIAKNADDPSANKELGDIYKAQGKDQDAAARYAVAAKSMPWDRQLLLDLGGLYEKLGKSMDALKVYRDYLKYDPANQEIKSKVRSLETVSSPAPGPLAPFAPIAPTPSPEPDKK